MNAHDPHQKRLAKLIQEVGRTEGNAQNEVFRDFLDAGYRAIRSAFLLGDAWQQNEDEYMKIVKRCRHPKETMTRYSEMLSVTVEALEAECADFLGPAFMEIGGSKHHGQFFTPHHLSKANAMMLMGDMAEMIGASRRGYFTAHEPAAGMGGMVLAVAQLMREKGFDPGRHCHWQMVDVEFKAMAGCYIQTSLAGVSGVVIHGNTLSLESWASSITPTAFLHPKSFRSIEPDGVPADDMVDPAPEIVPPSPVQERRQLAFDFS